RARDNRDMWRCRRRRRDREVVNLQDDAVLRRHDHVEAKCALMVERDPGVIRCVDWERRKQRDCNRRTRRDLKDLIALCDENVARGEPGIRRLGRSYSHGFFGVKFPKKSDFSLVRGTCSWGNMQPELSRILLFWQYAELRTKVALGWRGLPRPEAAKLCLLPDVERAFSEAHRQKTTNICLKWCPNAENSRPSTAALKLQSTATSLR